MASFADHPPLKVEALRELVEGGNAPFKQTPRSYVLWCPESSCRRMKLHVEKTTGMGKCFRCGFKGWANWVLARVYGRSPEELDQLLYGVVTVGSIIEANATVFKMTDFWGEEVGEDALLPTEPKYPPPMERSPYWCDITEPMSAPGREYLAKRGVSLEVAVKYGLGFDPAEQRLLFPVIVEGVLRGWQGRYVHATERIADSGRVIRIPKVMTVGKLGKDCFMFQDVLKGASVAILVEGPFDGLKCESFAPTVVSMGKDVSKRQLDILVRSGIKELYVGLDRDADRPTGAIVRDLDGLVKLYRLLPPPHRDDLGDCTVSEVAGALVSAERMTPAHVHQTYVPMPKLWS